ncbi:hypothetical protein ASG11_06565 [Sphingomonas sp. Leaf357]|uniref:hypothetical protein n=1 Tax=Sphingomonas sp. Leaf357 TaxID=1736350 RepID=UPI0007015748|nr:hypothetical protein [Sphingomonas sp. Leaf357]KQS03952.1 hypothetical protein ASG11_06565 [Sphingomonas sp. Leaf357]
MTGGTPDSGAQDHDAPTRERLVQEARRSIIARRALTGRLPPAFIPDPALDFLKALYVAQAEGRGMSRRELCDQTTVAPSVAARWIGALVAEALAFERAGEVHLSAHGLSVVEDGMRAVIAATSDLP